MAQNWTANSFATTNDWDDDLQAMENNLLCLQSGFSGTATPTSPVIGQEWVDTTNDVVKRRNFAGSGWNSSLHGDSTCIVYIYRNDANVGMQIETGMGDRVLAVKGGSQAWNVNGGVQAGTMTQPTNTWSIGNPTGGRDAVNFGAQTNVPDDGHGHSISGGAGAGDWRMAANVGTMQKPIL